MHINHQSSTINKINYPVLHTTDFPKTEYLFPEDWNDKKFLLLLR